MKMKRIVSILLVAVMLTSLCVAILPVNAVDGIAISTVEGLQGMASGNKYYLTQDITVPADKALNGTWHTNYIELDGQGHTITFAEGTGDKSLFSGGGSAASMTIKNLTIAGSVTINNATSHYAPFIRHGCDGVVILENVTSDVDIKITGTMAGAVGGVIGKIENYNGDISFKNVKYTGTIDLSEATATVDYKSNSTEVDTTNWRRSVGGIVGGITTNTNVVMENITVGTASDPAVIKVNGSSSFASYPVGGVVGYISNDAKFTLDEGSFNGSIVVTEATTRYIGGAVGQICANATITGFDVNADIDQVKPSSSSDGKSYNMIGGILGAWSHLAAGDLIINDCHFSGSIDVDNTGYGGVQGIGGIVGALNPTTQNKTGAVIIANCSNTADITAVASDAKLVGGIVGQACRLSSLTLMNNTNSGNLSSTGSGGWVGVGGIIATCRTIMDGNGWAVVTNSEIKIQNCSNSGTLNSIESAGGILGRTLEMSNGTMKFTIENCVNTGAVSGKVAGGIFGENDSNFTGFKINNCVNEGAITGTGGYAGGIAGAVNGSGSCGGAVTVTNAANKGTTTGSSGAAGIVGTAGHAVTITGCKTTTDTITNATATNVTTSEAGVAATAVDAYKTAIETAISTASLALDAESYLLNRTVTVTATGGPNAKLVLYKADNLTTPVLEYGVNEGTHVSGIAHSLNDVYGAQIPAGNYVLKLMDGATEKATKSFTVVAMGDIASFTGTATYAPASATQTKWRAAGTITVNCPENNIPDSYTLYWGNAQGKLTDYDAIGKISNVSTTAATYTISDTNILVPEGATCILAYAKRGNTECATPVSAALPEGAGAADRFGEAIARINIISDIHITNSADAKANQNFIKAMNDIIANTPDTQGIFVNGDVVEWGEAAEYKYLDTILAQISKDNDGYDIASKMYYGIGNHDLYNFSDSGRYTGAWDASSSDGQQAVTRTAAQNIAQFLTGTHNTTENGKAGKGYYDYWVNDMHFIFLCDEHVGSNDQPLDLTVAGNHPRREVAAQLSTAQLDWFEETILETKDGKEDNPVFVFLHQGIKNTVAGTLADEKGQNWHGVDGEDANRIKAIMKTNPNAIMLAGHSHYALGEYKTMVLATDKYPTTFNTAATKNQSTDTSSFDGASGYYVTIYEDKIVFSGRDFYNSKWISNSQLVIDWSENGKIVAEQTAVESPDDYVPGDNGNDNGNNTGNNTGNNNNTTDPDETTNNTPAETNPDGTPAVTDTAPAEKKGCFGTVSCGIVVVAAMLGAGVCVIRKKED